MDFEISFTDATINEGGGYYRYIKDIMKKHLLSGGISRADWTLRSNILLQHETGMCKLVCEFKFGPKIRICEYASSSKDIFNDDVRCFRYWSEKFGWGRPEVSDALIDDWMDFWKNQWELFMVDSSYLDNRFGKRREISDIQVEDKEEPEE